MGCIYIAVEFQLFCLTIMVRFHKFWLVYCEIFIMHVTVGMQVFMLVMLFIHVQVAML